MRWRLIGPFRAGRVSAGAVDPADPNTYYFGTPGGGVWKSTNAGQTWAPMFDATGMASIGALAIAPSNPQVIYAGTGEETRGDGVYRSADGGVTWTNVGLRDTHFIGSIVVSAEDPDTVVVRRDRRPHAGPGPRGVQDHRRRQDVDEGAVRRRQRRLPVGDCGARRAACAVRDALSRRWRHEERRCCRPSTRRSPRRRRARRRPHARRPSSRPNGRRRDVDAARREGSAVAARRPSGVRVRREERRPHRVRRVAGRALPIGGRRRDVDARH